MASFDPRVLEGVRVLVAIVDGKTFAKAADALGLTPSGVSRAVGRLEERLGVRLFERTTRSVRLTDEGRRFHDRVVPLLAELEEATGDVAEGAATIRGRLRVNVDPFFSRLVLAPRLGEFLDVHPGLQLELVTRDQLGDPVTDGFDLAVRFGHPRPSSLVARKLLDTRIITVASPSYLARHGRPADPRALESGDHVVILFRDPATGRPFPWEFHQRRRKVVCRVKGTLTVNDAGTLLGVCEAGHGVAQIMDLGAERLMAAHGLVELFPAWAEERFPLMAYFPSRRHVPAKTRAFLEFIAGLVPRTGKAGSRPAC